MSRSVDVGGSRQNLFVITPSRRLKRRWPLLAVPRARSLVLPSADQVTIPLFSVQSLEAYDILTKTGLLRCDSREGTTTEYPEFAESYSWLSGQMRRRLRPETGESESIMWAWAQIKWRDLYNDLRFRRPGGAVLLTLAFPRERVLLSGFGEWHDVLNRSLSIAPLRGESDDDWWKRAEPLLDDFSDRSKAYRGSPLSEWPQELRNELEQSWESIFDPRRWGSFAVQATMREIRSSDVVRAVRIW